MLKNHFKIAWRTVRRSPLYSLINVLGLSIGVTCALLIGIFVMDEISVNTSLRALDRQYVIESNWSEPGLGLQFTTLAPLAKAMKDDYPHLVADYYRIHGISANISNGEKHFRESVQIGDPSLLSMYGFELASGDATTSLQDPNAVVIKDHIALKFFGTTDVLGETLTIETSQADANPSGKKDFRISAVIESAPYNTVLDYGETNYSVFLSMQNIDLFAGQNADEWWDNRFIASLVELQPGVRPADLAEPMAALIAQHAAPTVQGKLETVLEPVRGYHLRQGGGGRQKMVMTLSVVALFILLMAIINFVNITIGQSSLRLKEIGIRKVLGGHRRQLIFQFLAESTFLTLIAFGVSVALLELSLPFFGEMVGKMLALETLPPAMFWGFLISVAIATSLLAGSYPAWVLSGLETAYSLKGKLRKATDGLRIKRLLLFLQFFIAICLLISAITISDQVRFFLEKPLGYSGDNVLIATSVPRDWSLEGVEKHYQLKQSFKQLPAITEVSLSFEIPDGRVGIMPSIYADGSPAEAAQPVTMVVCDPEYDNVYQLQLLEGTFLQSPNSQQLVINEQLAQQMGWEQPIGQQLFVQGNPAPWAVVGVVDNFHFASLHEDIAPMIMVHATDWPIYRYYSFKIAPNQYQAGIQQLTTTWEEVFPQVPFVSLSMEDKVASMYQVETRLKKAINFASFLGIVIVLMGVFGLVLQSLYHRRKEVSIRKILGANISHLLGLFSKEFIGVFVLANVLAWPLSYVLMQDWLDKFSYHTGLSLLSFLAASGLILSLVLIIIGLQSWKTTTENPIDALREE